MLCKEKAVVIGGAGFIGSHLVDSLLEKGFDVEVIDNLSFGKKSNVNSRAFLHEVDIRNYDDICPIIMGSKYVFHLAAIAGVQYSIENPIETHDVNLTGTLNILVASHEGGVEKVVYSSSSAVYGDQDTMPLIEEMKAQPKSPYGLQKYLGEKMCKLWGETYGLSTVGLRYFNVYGSRQSAEGTYAAVVSKFLKQLKDKKPLLITGDGEQTRDFVHVKDVVLANIMAAESVKANKGDVFNIGSGKSISMQKLAKLVGGVVEKIPSRFEPKHSQANCDKAKEFLGWQAHVLLKEGVEDLKKKM